MCGGVPTSPHFRFASIAGQYPGAPGDAPLSAKALMKEPPTARAGRSDDLVSRDDEGLFVFIDTLRLSVRAKVAAEQQRGLSLSEIVAQVREMVRLAEDDAQRPNFPSRAFRAISRQAVGWCVESYRPLVFAAGNELSDPLNASDPNAPPPVLAPAKPAAPFPAQSPAYRGLP